MTPGADAHKPAGRAASRPQADKGPRRFAGLLVKNEGVLPFYIFHQTIILCVGWFVISWNIGIGPKYLIIALVSFALIMALYHLLVRRFNLMRFFFGMRPKKKPSKTPDPSPATTSA